MANQQMQAALESARQENLLAKHALNQLWKVLPDEQKSQLSDAQKAWVDQKKIDCQVEAAQKSTDPTQNEIDRLNCDTQKVKDRLNYLR